MAQPLHVPPKPAESAKLRIRLYEIILSKWFKQVLPCINFAGNEVEINLQFLGCNFFETKRMCSDCLFYLNHVF